MSNQREIKFRAWDKKTGCMIVVDAIFFKGGYVGRFHSREETVGATIGPGDNGEMEEYEQSPVLMQYTGLKDKNGREIYEGDILSGSFCGSPGNRVVTYQPRTMQFVFIDPHGLVGAYDDLEWTSPHRIEVIGNIYETPELLSNKT
jgi:hypothetical protein